MKIKCGFEIEIAEKFGKLGMELIRKYLTTVIDCNLTELPDEMFSSIDSFVEFYDDDGNLIPVADDEEPLVSC